MADLFSDEELERVQPATAANAPLDAPRPARGRQRGTRRPALRPGARAA